MRSCSNEPSTSNFSISPSSVTINETVYFNGSLSTDSDGRIVNWEWNFGDGNTSTLQNPTHTYASDGTYTVTLYATSPKGTSTYTGTVVILAGVLDSFTAGTSSPSPGTNPQVM
ncbi:MAG: PKD domain-containing protein, partial [Proteobacteria bacterium]|nr:PKD domain-containing protein [Pseudomonadota bacterium]